MELLILMVALALWILQKVLSSSNKEEANRRKKRRPPAPAPWRDPWGERTDSLPFPDLFGEHADGDSARSTSPSAAGPVKENIQRIAKKIEEAKEQVKDVQAAVSEAEKPEETLKKVQPPIPDLKGRKKSLRLEKGLFTKDSLVRGILLHEILGPPPSRRYFQGVHRRNS